MKIKDYMIIEADSHIQLASRVNEWIKNRYVPFGSAYSVAYVVMSGKNVWHYQPMVKYESAKVV